LSARISAYELAYRMQGCAPEVVNIDNESEATKKLYGLDNKNTEAFGRQCLLGRRLVERGVRFVQLYEGGTNGNQFMNTWDAHNNLKANHELHANACDVPIAGLLTDLKARGLLNDTLVIWHGEFGRMPISQRGVGRDHNPGAQTVWMAGAGIKGGQVIGSTDDFGYKAAEQPTSIHDLHATLLHLLGMDHTKLTYRFNGRDMRLTDVGGELIPQIVA
jgi:membrane-anchored protein YejM (alkaline phosphatase superfamily)